VSVFSAIFILNILGFIPYSYSITSQFSVTIGVALVVCTTLAITSLAYHKLNFEGFIINFVPKGAPTVGGPFLVLIEIISYLIRPFSMGLRLAANITAGHLILGIFV